MNTERKPISWLECDECGDIYEKVGDADIRLAFPPRHARDLKLGTCPKHQGK